MSESGIKIVVKVLFSGDRDWKDRWIVSVIARGLSVKYKTWVGIQGGAPGLDTIARRIIKRINNAKGKTYPARWGAFGHAAGPLRNQHMLDQDPDVVFVFHNDLKESKGTKDMAKRSVMKGTRTYLILELSKDNLGRYL